MLRKPKAKRRLWVKGSCGRQADGTAGLPSTPEYTVRSRTYASCQQPTSHCRAEVQLARYAKDG
jgi:hypothetical protein